MKPSIWIAVALAAGVSLLAYLLRLAQGSKKKLVRRDEDENRRAA